ncbi:MAG: hypothetical protein LBS60_05230 [Deltaproteobacteria bacterium]|jgi:hypothetical protein|nr:hypothetical protein [Deltaproteobacteria bacterium]
MIKDKKGSRIAIKWSGIFFWSDMARLLGLALIFGLLAVTDPAGAFSRDFIWWRLIDYRMNTDGGHQVNFNLMVESQKELTDLEVIFLMSPYERSGAIRGYQKGSYFQKAVSPKQRDISFYSGVSARLDIFARGKLGDTPVYAQTILSTFGQSNLPDPEARPIDAPPTWPTWRFADSPRFYRAQTGTPLAMSISPKPSLVKVFEDQVVMANYPGADQKTYEYSSPHNQSLAKKGYTEKKKDVVFVAYLDDGAGEVSFSLPVYRAYYGQLDYGKGLVVMGATLLGTVGLVGLKGRRFKGA